MEIFQPHKIILLVIRYLKAVVLFDNIYSFLFELAFIFTILPLIIYSTIYAYSLYLFLRFRSNFVSNNFNNLNVGLSS